MTDNRGRDDRVKDDRERDVRERDDGKIIADEMLEKERID